MNSFTVRTNIVTTWLFGAVNGHGAFYIKETNKEDSVRFLDPLIYGLQHGYWACRTIKENLIGKLSFYLLENELALTAPERLLCLSTW